MRTRKILLVEDKRGMRAMLTTALTEEGWSVTAVADGENAIRALKEEKFSALLTDVCMPGTYTGLDVLRAAPGELPVIVMTAFGTVDMAVAAMKLGARDFITKPFQLDDLLEKLGTACQDVSDCMLGESQEYLEAISRAERAAGSGMNVLLSGESGTGKELLARRMHMTGSRSDGPFIPVNCAAIPENLMESELFGAEKGAYTGSSEARPGRFTMARGGVIFLDEIGDLDLNLQGKLLRVLESGSYHSVGGTSELKTDAWVVSASNRDLREMTARGSFREDLFFRVAEFPVFLPPLRNRGDDIIIIARHFLEQYRGTEFSQEAIRLMLNYSWPGNVRELRSTVRRACVNSRDGVVTPELLEIESASADSITASDDLAGNMKELAAEAARKREEQLIRDALAKTGGNKTRAAELLGVSYRTLLTKIREMNIEKQ